MPSLTYIPRGEIPPQSEEKKAASGFKLRKNEENGSRVYQLVLHEMALHPNNIPAYNTVPSNDSQTDTEISITAKNKKCSISESNTSGTCDDNQTKKKKNTSEDGNEEFDINMIDDD